MNAKTTSLKILIMATFNKDIDLKQAKTFIRNCFDDLGFLIKDTYYKRKKAQYILDQFGDELYECGLYNAALIVANPNSDI